MTHLALIFLGVATSVAAVCLYRRRSRKRRWLRCLTGIATVLLLLIGLLLSLTGGSLYWYHHRGQPEPTQRTLYTGVEYIREVRQHPRRMVIHIIKVDLSARGIGFIVTPPDRPQANVLKARTTTQFLTEFKAQVAINASFFREFHSNSPWDYYPHVGDPVRVLGTTASRGDVYNSRPVPATGLPPTCYFSQTGEVRIGAPSGPIYNAISGSAYLLRDGQPISTPSSPEPRVALGLDAQAKTLYLLVIDGRQPNYSEGAALDEVGPLLARHGATIAIALDGGGSATMAAADANGQPYLLNCPIHTRIPYRQRPVANHLGVYALKK